MGPIRSTALLVSMFVTSILCTEHSTIIASSSNKTPITTKASSSQVKNAANPQSNPIYTTQPTLAISQSDAETIEMPDQTTTNSPSNSTSSQHKAASESTPGNKPDQALSKTQASSVSASQFKSLTPFTGRVTRNKVRMRLQPSLEASIVRELEKNDLLVVIGAQDEFYAIKPMANIRGYVFRTYVLDGTVEGNNVNVRLEPDLNAPIIAQLSQGDHVEGTVSHINSKWLEIAPPSSCRFWVAKEYINQIGDANLYQELQKKRVEIDSLIGKLENKMHDEMHKPFDRIQIAPIANQLKTIITQNPELPAQTEKAQELLQKMQEAYLQKKLESQANDKAVGMEVPSSQEAVSSKVANSNPRPEYAARPSVEPESTSATTCDTKPYWEEVEKQLYELENDGSFQSMDDWYAKQLDQAISLEGIIRTVDKPLKNRPGDYVLVDPQTNLPIGYLYSTKVNLSTWIGKEMTLLVSSRPNNFYAFPAYFVLKQQ